MREYLHRKFSKKFIEKATRYVWIFFLLLIIILAIGHAISSKKIAVSAPLPATPLASQGVQAQSYMIANIDTGQIYTEKNQQLIYPVASITKLMTAIVANNTFVMSSTLEMLPLVLTLYGNKDNFEYGEKLTINQLFYFLLMESDNAVAETLSMSVGDPIFVNKMNVQAKALGLSETTFTDSTGLDAGDRSTVTDIFHLAQYISKSEPFIWQITASPDRTIEDSGYMHIIQSANLFSADPRFVGGKVGYTSEAGETMIALFKLPVKSMVAGKTATTTQTIAFIVLDSQSRDADIGKLLEWFQSNYSGN